MNPPFSVAARERDPVVWYRHQELYHMSAYLRYFIGCIALTTAYSPIFHPCPVPPRSNCDSETHVDARHGDFLRYIIRACETMVTPGAVGVLMATSGMSVVPSTFAMTVVTAPLTMQWAQGYSGCNGVLSIGRSRRPLRCRIVVDVAIANSGHRSPKI